MNNSALERGFLNYLVTALGATVQDIPNGEAPTNVPAVTIAGQLVSLHIRGTSPDILPPQIPWIIAGVPQIMLDVRPLHHAFPAIGVSTPNSIDGITAAIHEAIIEAINAAMAEENETAISDAILDAANCTSSGPIPQGSDEHNTSHRWQTEVKFKLGIHDQT